MIDILINNEEYKSKNYAKALEETFVEIDYLKRTKNSIWLK